jgi:tetratricopeptide (TPR) repeat protein
LGTPVSEHVETIPSDSDDIGDFGQLEIEDSQEIPAARNSQASQNSAHAANVFPFRPAQSNLQVNEMFADLMEEVSSPAGREAEKLSFEEHFSLGTAYRDMDLIEEAIQEFQKALRAIDLLTGDPKVIQCCGMLSTCFLKKNMPRSALRWCQTGLNMTDISSHEAMALRYDMGVAHLMAGSNERALECFDEIFNMDPTYRDVAQRIDELRGGFERHAP